MNYKLIIFISFVAMFGISSCNIYNPVEPVPSYIHIDNITVTKTSSPANQGSSSSKISDAWVYIDGQLVGCFEMPCTFPVLSDGNHNIRIRPGIKVNGIAADRSPYPFYSEYNNSIILQRGNITLLKGVTVSYLSSTTFEFNEDFESVGIIFQKTNASADSLIPVTAPSLNVFEGQHAAIGYLKSSQILFECTTVANYFLPTGGSAAFLEFNYKCNNSFTVSTAGYDSQGNMVSQAVEALTFNPSDNWNKAYLYLTPDISQLSGATNFKIYFDMYNLNGSDSVGFAIDNIKLLH